MKKAKLIFSIFIILIIIFSIVMFSKFLSSNATDKCHTAGGSINECKINCKTNCYQGTDEFYYSKARGCTCIINRW